MTLAVPLSVPLPVHTTACIYLAEGKAHGFRFEIQHWSFILEKVIKVSVWIMSTSRFESICLSDYSRISLSNILLHALSSNQSTNKSMLSLIVFVLLLPDMYPSLGPDSDMTSEFRFQS